ncbi:MAG: DHH family phosphoesterase [Ruthenibacterium sp.]
MKRQFTALDAVLLLLSVACVCLAAALALANPLYLIPVCVVLAVVGIVIFGNIRRLRRKLQALLHGAGYADSDTQHSLAQLKLPVMVLSDTHIMWYNDAFKAQVLQNVDACLLPVNKVLPMFDRKSVLDACGQSIVYEGRSYEIYGCETGEKSNLLIAYFVDNTEMKQQADEYLATRPSVMLIAVDTYDEIIKELKESERARISGEIDLALEQFIGATTGFIRRIGTARYLAVLEERHMLEIVRSRFSLLDTVRNIGDECAAVTLSIGVGRMGKTLCECEQMAVQALDMALGRGGDQVAVKSEEGFEFYGGISRAPEKRSKVRSRIIATALKDLIAQSDSVLIMGHKMSDLDAMGAAIGVLRICEICKKPAAIVLEDRATLAQPILREFSNAGRADDFIRPEEAQSTLTKKTLLVIVDTHLKQIVESKALYEAAKNVVVIDHHRKAVGHIDNAVIFYHEPAASSASELVSELLQYVDSDKDTRLTPLEAQALLAGIMLDTRDFSIHTGVRTFEAAAYLRRMGAQTVEVKKLFNSSVETYTYKAKLVTQAEIYMGCAVVVAGKLPEDGEVAVPQAANDLLSIEGVEASFVAVDAGGQINISARSMGEVNVQVILETMGGGGHLTMAGAQLKDASLDDAKRKIFEAIAAYRENQRKGG